MTNCRPIDRIAIGLLIVGGLFLSHCLQVVSASRKPGTQQQSPSNTIVKEMSPSELGHIGYLDYLNGFRKRKFGTDISQFPDLTLIKDSGAQKTYVSKTEQLEIGEATLKSINYIFYKNKFMGVLLSAHGQENSHQIYRVFVAGFGSGIKPPSTNGGDEYFWTGKTANARLAMKGKDALELWIGNNQLQEEYDKEYREKLLQAAAKGF